MKYDLLVNPASGNGKGLEASKALVQHLTELHLDYKLYQTKAAGEEAALVKKILSHREPADFLLIVGGDGTLSLAINALPANIPFSFIPAGSGNDFARAMGISQDSIEVFDHLAVGQTREFYVIHYQSDRLTGTAVNNIGIGLDAAIVKATNESSLKNVLNKLKLGQASYFLTALGVIFHKKAFKIQVGETHYDNAFLFTLTKQPYFGGGIKIAPDASNLTDQIELVELNKIPFRLYPRLIKKMLTGKHLTDSHFKHQSASTFTVSVRSTEPVQIDGESYELTADNPLTLTTEKRKIIL